MIFPLQIAWILLEQNIYCKQLPEIICVKLKSFHQSSSNPDAFPLFENRVCAIFNSHSAEVKRECVYACGMSETACVCTCVFERGRVNVFLLLCWNKPPVMVGVGQDCFRAWTAPVTSPFKEGGQKLHIFLKAKTPLCTEWVHSSVWPTEACSTPRESARIVHCFIPKLCCLLSLILFLPL